MNEEKLVSIFAKSMQLEKTNEPEECINNLIALAKEIDVLHFCTGQISDGYHTFDDLYEHRCILYSVICNQNKDKAWKSKLHSDGTMYDDMFIVGLETPAGMTSYHYSMKYWDLFKVKEISNAPEWDGYTPEDVLQRLQSLN